MATQSQIFKRANVLIKQGRDRKQAFAMAYEELGKPTKKAVKKNPVKMFKITFNYSAARGGKKEKELFGERNEGVIIEASSKDDAVNIFNSNLLPGHRYNPFYLKITEIKTNPASATKRKTSATTMSKAVGYVNRPSQITKKSPTKRLKVRRTKNLQIPRGVFPNPINEKKHYIIQAWKGSRMMGFVTMEGRISTNLQEAWQFPTKKDADYHAKKYAAKSSAYDFKIDSVEIYYGNPVNAKLSKRDHTNKIKPLFRFKYQNRIGYAYDHDVITYGGMTFEIRAANKGLREAYLSAREKYLDKWTNSQLKNPVSVKLGKISPSSYPQSSDYPYRVESSLDGYTYRSEGSFNTEMNAREYARALDRKHGGRLWIKVSA